MSHHVSRYGAFADLAEDLQHRWFLGVEGAERGSCGGATLIGRRKLGKHRAKYVATESQINAHNK